MFRARRLVFPPLLLLVAVATLPSSSCKDKPTAPPPGQLAGAWTATRAEYVSKTSVNRVDLVAAGGAATLFLTVDGDYTYVEVPAGAAPDTTRGRWTASGDVMELTPEGASFSRVFDLYFAGNILRLTGGDVLHDFGGGTLEECDLNLAFTR